jgi:predicted nucleotidyltransferase
MHTPQPDQLSRWLFPRVRTAVLARLLLDNREWHARELARLLGLNHAAISKELHNLREAGLALSRRSGSCVYFRADERCPIYGELKMIMTKTAGLADVIRAAVAPLAASIDLAYIYGSQAAGTARSDSDVDVMIVGAVGSRDVAAALEPAEAQLGRAINASVYSAAEYRAKLKLKRGFPYTAHVGQTIELIGTRHEP